MADTRDITITIISKNGDEENIHDENAGKGQPVNPTNKNTKVTSYLKSSNDPNKYAQAAAAFIAISGAKQLLENTIQLTLNRYYNMSENYISQNEYRNIMTGVSKVASLGGTIVSGATSGFFIGGPVGGVVGGLVAGLGWGANEYVNAQATKSQYYSQINASNINVAYMRERAGLYMNGKGTEN